MEDTSRADISLPLIGTAPLILALLMVDSLHFVFALLLLPLISPAVSAMFVLSIATLEVGVYGLVRRCLHPKVLGRHLALFLAMGLLVATSTSINFHAVAFIDPGTAALLSENSILFGLGFGLVWMRERLGPVQVVGALLALGGVFIITFQPGDYLRLGSVMVLGSSFLYATHAALAKRYAGDIDFLDFFFFRLLCTAGFLFIFAVGRGALTWPSPQAWPLLILVGTVDVVVSRSLYYLALRRLPISIHSIVLTLSPVVTVAWSLLLFGSRPTPQQLLGGAAVIAGVLIVTLHRSKGDKQRV